LFVRLYRSTHIISWISAKCLKGFTVIAAGRVEGCGRITRNYVLQGNVVLIF